MDISVRKFFDVESNTDNKHEESSKNYTGTADAEYRTKLAYELAILAYWELDVLLNKFICSEELAQLMDFNKDQLIYDVGFFHKFIHPDYKEIVRDYFKQLLVLNEPKKIEFKVILENGINKILRANAKAVKTEAGVHKIIGAFQDITDDRITENKLRDQFNFINTLIDTIPNPIFYKDSNLIYRHANTSFCEYIGLKKENIINHTAFDIAEIELANIYQKADLKLLQNKGKQRYQSSVKYNDGSQHEVIFNKAVVFNENGEVTGMVGVINDITERIEIEKKLERLMNLKDSILEINHSIMDKNNLKELYELILEKVLKVMKHADVGCILTLDENNIFSIAASVGYSEEEAEAYNFKLEDSFQWKKTKGNIDKTIIINDLEEYFKGEVIPKLLNNKKGLSIKSSVSAPIIIEGKLFGLINIDSHKNNVFDETDWIMMDYLRSQLVNAISRYKLYESIIYLSEHDKLTGVYNRRHFENLFNMIKDRSQRYNDEFFVAIFDLNGLKEVNDTYGHLAGDELIVQFTQKLKSRIRTSDILARYGGDEFVVIFFEAQREDIVNRLNSLKNYFYENPIAFEESNIVCSFSYGLAHFPMEGTCYDELIGMADKNMYLYKSKLKYNG